MLVSKHSAPLSAPLGLLPSSFRCFLSLLNGKSNQFPTGLQSAFLASFRVALHQSSSLAQPIRTSANKDTPSLLGIESFNRALAGGTCLLARHVRVWYLGCPTRPCFPHHLPPPRLLKTRASSARQHPPQFKQPSDSASLQSSVPGISSDEPLP